MYEYGWTSAEVSHLSLLPTNTTDFQLGPYISLMGYARGAMLLVVVPRESSLRHSMI
jgi:hypothetical protein